MLSKLTVILVTGSVLMSACAGPQSAAPLGNGVQSSSYSTGVRLLKRAKPNASAYAYVESGSGITATAQCPTGDHVVGGGFANISETKNTTESHWADQHTAWVSSNPYALYSYAVCANSTVQTSYQTAVVSGAGGADCTSSQSVSGGGFNATSGKVVADYTPNSVGWSFDTYHDLGAGTVYAACTNGGAYTYKYAGPGSDETAQCPSGDVVVGGGFAEANATEPASFVAYLSHYADNHTAWRAAATGSTLYAFAVCTSSGS